MPVVTANWPAGHVEQLPPVPALPMGHAWHTAAVASGCLPSGHSLQIPPIRAWDTGQVATVALGSAVHGVDGSLSSSSFPMLLHEMHRTPRVALYRNSPAVHAVHWAIPADAVNLPAAHVEQLPPVPALPLGHAWHTTDVASGCLPAGHKRHFLAAVLESDEVTRICLAPHVGCASHTVRRWLTALWYVSLGQIRHVRFAVFESAEIISPGPHVGCGKHDVERC